VAEVEKGWWFIFIEFFVEGWKKNLGKLIEFAKDEGRRGGRDGGREGGGIDLEYCLGWCLSQRGERKRRRLRAW